MDGDKELVALFASNTTEYSRVTYQMIAKVICVYSMRIELVVKLVFEMKSAVDFLSPE